LEYGEIVCRWIDKQELWEIVDNVRDQYWEEGILPVDVEKIVEFKMKLGIEPIHNLFSLIDMDAFLKGDLTAIVVDHDFYMNEKFSNRLRFSFAHELGHFFLHQYAYSQFDFASPSEWRDFIQNIPEKEYGNFEWQANEFAGRLLVPFAELSKALNEALRKLENSNLQQYLAKDPDAVLSGISPLICRRFGVSSEVIETRIRREGMWPPF
jgi:hypothetical protein